MKDKVTRETRIIYDCIKQGSYSIEKSLCEGVDWTNVLRQASLNRVLYSFAKNLDTDADHRLAKIVKVVLSEGEKHLSRLDKTVRRIILSLSSEKIPFLIFKTYRTIPYVTPDVDVIVRAIDFGRAAEVLLKETVAPVNSWFELYKSKMEAHVKAAGLALIDLYTFQNSFWQGWDEYLDIDFIWENPRMIKVKNEEWPVPSAEAELALMIIHVLHERLQITLLEFLFLKHIHQEANWDFILGQSKKYGWFKSLLRFLSIVNELNSNLCPQERDGPLIDHHVFSKKVGIPKSRVNNPLSMPYVYQIPYALELFAERAKSNHSHTRVFKFAPYYFFAKIRYHATRGKKVPVYHHWFPFEYYLPRCGW